MQMLEYKLCASPVITDTTTHCYTNKRSYYSPLTGKSGKIRTKLRKKNKLAKNSRKRNRR